MRPRRPLVVGVAVLLVVALVGGSVGGAVGLFRLFDEPRRVAVAAPSAAFEVGGLQVADGWWLVTGGGRTSPDQEIYQVLAGVSVTNGADSSRSGDLGFVFRTAAGEVVGAAVCLTGVLEPGETVTVDCEGPRQLVPTDYDRLEAQLLD